MGVAGPDFPVAAAGLLSPTSGPSPMVSAPSSNEYAHPLITPPGGNAQDVPSSGRSAASRAGAWYNALPATVTSSTSSGLDGGSMDERAQHCSH